jgi:hypothetical protein
MLIFFIMKWCNDMIYRDHILMLFFCDTIETIEHEVKKYIQSNDRNISYG